MTVRILHVNAGNLYGGIETMLATMARHRRRLPALEQRFALCFEGRLARELAAAGAPPGLLGAARLSRPWTVLRARSRLERMLAHEPVDAVLFHGSWSHALFGATARASGARVVAWIHAEVSGSHPLELLAARVPPDLVVANSLFTAASARRFFRSAPIRVVRCPVSPIPPAAAPGDVRRELGADPADVVIVSACRPERLKGLHLLVEALARLRDVPRWKAWIAGGVRRPAEASYLEELVRRARRGGIADRVAFLGERADVPRLLAAADLYCQPNTGPEGFGIGFVEALLVGLPVVTTAIGGALEIVDESCGVLIAPEVTALTETLARLVCDRDERTRLGRGGPARARALCDPGRSLADLLAALSGDDRGDRTRDDGGAASSGPTR